jgi:hypothetical protein
MKTLCRLIVGMLVVVWLAGCGDEQKAADASGAKPAEAATQPNGAAPVAQVQQSMAIGQVVDQAAGAGGGSSKAGVRAANSIDKLNAQKKSEE